MAARPAWTPRPGTQLDDHIDPLPSHVCQPDGTWLFSQRKLVHGRLDRNPHVYSEQSPLLPLADSRLRRCLTSAAFGVKPVGGSPFSFCLAPSDTVLAAMLSSHTSVRLASRPTIRSAKCGTIDRGPHRAHVWDRVRCQRAHRHRSIPPRRWDCERAAAGGAHASEHQRRNCRGR